MIIVSYLDLLFTIQDFISLCDELGLRNKVDLWFPIIFKVKASGRKSYFFSA